MPVTKTACVIGEEAAFLSNLLQQAVNDADAWQFVADDQDNADCIIANNVSYEVGQIHCIMLQAGESGSLTLPFTIQELLHSLENAAANTHAVISISNAVQLDSRARSLMHQMNGATLALTELEQRIFMALYQASEHKLDKAALLKQVWGYSEDITTNTLDTHLYRLRTKLRDIFSESELNIETLDGVYILKYACH